MDHDHKLSSAFTNIVLEFRLFRMLGIWMMIIFSFVVDTPNNSVLPSLLRALQGGLKIILIENLIFEQFLIEVHVLNFNHI